MKIVIQILAIFALVPLTPMLQAQERTIEDVKNVVYTFFDFDSIVSSRGLSSAKYRNNIEVTNIDRGNTTYLYVVNMPDSGWAIVSNEQQYPTIIGYSTASHFDTNPDHQPGALKLLLEHHMNMIDSLRESPSTFYDRVSSPSPLSHNLPGTRYSSDYALLKRNGEENLWRQSKNNDESYDCDKVYNKFCPTWYDTDPICNRTIVGCTAVAMAQVLWYWRWPDYVIMYESINMAGTPYGETSRHYYDWDNMPASINNSTLMYQVDMVAGLLRDCGYAAHTLYMYDGSESIPTKLTYALEHYYNFHVNPCFEYSWMDFGPILQYEIANNRPIICQAGNNGGGHTFVIDGYDPATNKYHVNWGWGWADDVMWDIGLNGYSSLRTFFTELYPDCSVREANVTSLDISTVTSGSDVTLYSANNVSLSQLTVRSGGHLNISAGNKITLNSGFVAQIGSMVKLATNYNCTESNAPVSMPKHKDNNVDRICSTSNFKVTPNPAMDEIMLQCDIPIIKVFLYNVNGQIVLHTTDTHIDISYLPKGLYIIRAVTEAEGILQTKIIKM